MKFRKFEELKKQYDIKLELYLKNNNAKSISELTKEHRKSQLQFLDTLITEVENEIKASKKSSTVTHSYIVYAAMLVIIELAGKGDLRISLNSCLNITSENDLSPKQKADCLSTLNTFMNHSIFKDKDSRNGFEQIHPFQSIASKDLSNILNKLYDMDKAARTLEINALSTSGTSSPTPSFKQQKSISPKPLINHESWEKLNEAYDVLKSKEETKQGTNDIKRWSAPRNVEFQFLEQLRVCLNEFEAAEKTEINKNSKLETDDKTKKLKQANAHKMAIFLGAMYLIHGKIDDLYKKSYVGHKEASVTFSGLDNILMGKAQKPDSPQNIEMYLIAIYQFLRHLAVEQNKTKPEKKPTEYWESEDIKASIRSKHAFSDIKGFDVKKMLTLNIEMICKCRSQSLGNCITEIQEAEIARKKEEEKANPKPKSSWGFWGSGKTEKEEVKEVADDDLFEDNTAAETAPEENAEEKASTAATI